MLLIVEVDCHDVDHVMFEVVKLYLVGLLSVDGDVQENLEIWKNHPL